MMMICTLTMSSILWFMASNQPMIMLVTIIASTLMLASENVQLSGTPWYSFIIIMVFVGGLMILYVFVVAMTPNQKLENNSKMMILVPMAIASTFIWSKSEMENNKLTSEMFNSSWYTIIMAIMIILILMAAVSSVIYNPFSPVKSMK